MVELAQMSPIFGTGPQIKKMLIVFSLQQNLLAFVDRWTKYKHGATVHRG